MRETDGGLEHIEGYWSKITIRAHNTWGFVWEFN